MHPPASGEGKRVRKVENLFFGGVDGISCQHLQVMVTNLLQTHWKWQEEKSRDETRNGGNTDDVAGKLGYQDGLR